MILTWSLPAILKLTVSRMVAVWVMERAVRTISLIRSNMKSNSRASRITKVTKRMSKRKKRMTSKIKVMTMKKTMTSK